MLPQARQEKLLVQDVADELVIYDQARHRAHRLNRTAAWVWQHCDGQTSVAELTSLLPGELGLPAEGAVVWLALAQLDNVHLLREPLLHSSERPKVSRREVVRRLGITGALSMLLPLISSISAPTPAMAQSQGGGGRCKDGTECRDITCECSNGTTHTCLNACGCSIVCTTEPPFEIFTSCEPCGG